jgi:purine nucleosidase/pyrimidine-specific ribonucleoside hydrolase
LDQTGNLKYPSPAVSPISTPAVELLPRIADESLGEITLVAIGPLTNVAKAIIADPERMRQYKQIFIMGGAFRTYGNTTTTSEFNIFVDPHAAQVVVESGIPLVFVPLDVTEQVCLDMGHIEQEVRPLGTRLSEFLADLTHGYIEYHVATEGFSGCFLHDPLAVGVAIDESFARMRDGHVEIETEGRVTTGMTVCDLRPNPVIPKPPNACICVEVDVPRFIRFFLDRIKG